MQERLQMRGHCVEKCEPHVRAASCLRASAEAASQNMRISAEKIKLHDTKTLELFATGKCSTYQPIGGKGIFNNAQQFKKHSSSYKLFLSLDDSLR
jgi:hypothetical protein